MIIKLNERYAASTTASKIAVMTNLIHSRYDGSKDMGEYLSEMESLFNRLDAMGSPLGSDMQVAILLVSLSAEEWLSGTVSAIKTMDADKATWEYVSGRLLEEVRSQKLAENAEAKASSSTAAMARQKKDRSSMRCFKCNEIGHIARYCKNKKGSNKQKKEDRPKIRAALARKSKIDADFIVDSGCTQHITNDLKNFTKVYDIDPIKVHLADDRIVEAKQEGSVQIELSRRGKGKHVTQLMLSRVLYIPDAGANLISCTQLDSVGISTLIEKGECIFLDRHDKHSHLGYASRRASDNLYVIQGLVLSSKVKSLCAVKTEESPSGVELWHRRLGHISKDRIEKMADGMVEGLDTKQKAKKISCVPCVEAKQAKSPAIGKLAKGDIHHVIHSDIIGPISPRTIGGARYILCFIVEASRYAKIFIIKKRSEVLACFKEFQSWIERTTDVLVKRFHSDNAKEYVSMGKYLREEGITQTFSTAYTPQSNGLAERYNRTLLDKVRSMLQDTGLEMKFWGEAALHAAYLTNVTGGKANQGKKPFELIHGVKPNIEKLRVFGCAAYIHEPKEKRIWKLARRGMPGILLGHENGLCRVWNLEREEVNQSKHVVVDETVFPGRNIVKSEKEEESDELYVKFNLNDTVEQPFASSAVQHTEEIPDVIDQTIPAEYDEQSSKEETQERRYPKRVRFAPDRYVANAARRGAHDDDMPTLRMAMESPEALEWKKAIKSELDSLEKNRTWDIVDKPSKARAIFCKWVLKKKRTADGEISRYKARLVICGNLDNSPIAHTFAPVVDFTIVRLVLAIAAQKRWLIHQVDYSNAFLQGDLEREVYMVVPKMMEGVSSNKVCLLRKSLYGLREAPRIWYELLSKELKAIGLKPIPSAPCVFQGDDVMVLCYVDDLLVMAKDEVKLKDLKAKLAEKLPANDMGLAIDFLGMKIAHGEGYVTLIQSKYAEALVKNMGLVNCNGSHIPCDTSIDLSTASEEAAAKDFPYRGIVGSMLYIATHTRPDIAVATNMLARYVDAPSKKHEKAAI